MATDIIARGIAENAQKLASQASEYAMSAEQSAQIAETAANIASVAQSSAEETLNSIPEDYTELSASVEELKSDLDYQESNILSGSGKVFEAVKGKDRKTNFDISICTNSASNKNAIFSNGFVADKDMIITSIDIDASTIRVVLIDLNNSVWEIHNDITVNDGKAICNLPVKAGQEVYVGWQEGDVKYSENMENISYISYPSYNSSNNSMLVHYVVGFNINYNYYDKTEWYDVSSIITRKSLNWLAVGDSITYGDTNDGVSYADYIADKIKINLLKEGHSGYPLRTLLEKFASFDTDNKADIITIFAGTNDFNLSLGAGTENDIYSRDVKTIWATCNTLFPYLLNRYPTKPIIFFTPIQRKYSGSASGIIKGMVDTNGITLREYAQSIIDAGKKYGIPVVDLYSVSGIGVNNISEMTNDGLHPNEIGQKRIANIVLSEIMKYTQII